MLFSTKAEYGVRLMVELGRQPGSEPVALNAVAASLVTHRRAPAETLASTTGRNQKDGFQRRQNRG